MDKKKKSGKRTLILVGISVICIVVGALSWGYYKKVTEFKTSFPASMPWQLLPQTSLHQSLAYGTP